MKHELSPKYRFILRYGVLAYGGVMFLLFNVIHILRLTSRGASLAGLPLWLAVNAIFWPLVGYGFGLFAWHRMIRKAAKRAPR